MKRFTYIVTILTLCACAAPPNPNLDWAQRLDTARRVNENWSADCTRDQVTNTRRCFAGTFDSRSRSFQVYFINNSGPFIAAGAHTFPGRKPEIRFDNDQSSMTIQDDAGVSSNRPQQSIVSRMLTAQTANLRAHTWPDGSRDSTINVRGFAQAWTRLSELRAGAPSASETIARP